MASHVERRKFLATRGGAAAWPLAVDAEQSAITLSALVWRVDFPGCASPFARSKFVYDNGLE
jgi:hypothetical protein